MANKTFVLTVTSGHKDSPINFNVITPDGNYKSGSRVRSEEYSHALDKCLAELKSSILAWNSNHPDDEFPIK